VLNRFSRKLTFLVALTVIVMLGSTVATAQDEEVVYEPGDEVVVGVSLGLSGEGIAPLGIDIQRGVEIANADRPTVTVDDEEWDVVLDSQDSLCSAEGGQTVANRFTADDTIVGVVGPMCSSACDAAAPIYDSADFTTISPSCTNPALTTSGYTSFNRATSTDAIQGELAADFIYNTLGLTKLATVHDGSPYGQGLVEYVETNFEELGGEVVARDAVTVGDTDFRSLLEDFAAEEPEVVYFGGFPAEGARLMQQLPDAGLEDVVFIGADGIQGTEVIELAGEASEGTYASAPIPIGDDYDAFLEVYRETYNEDPPAPFHANGYDSYNLILDAIEAVGQVDDDGNLVVNRADIREWIRSVDGVVGLIGTYEANGEGETLSNSGYNFFIVEDGKYVPVATMDTEEGESSGG
jgi:branched-chain amino acid transport system substrate-binding protein